MSTAKHAEREAARALRREGLSLAAIADRLGVAKSSVSVWVRDVPLPEAAEPLPPACEPPEDTPAAAAAGPSRHCPRCARDLPRTAFNRSGDGLAGWCRECYSAYHRERRAENRQILERLRARARGHVAAIRAAAACADCGLREPDLLEFDHVDGKLANVARLLGNAAHPDRLDEEIARCEIVCVNCHRRRTAHRAGHRRGLARWWDAPPPVDPTRALNIDLIYGELERTGCVDCGIRELAVLDFDHVEGKTNTVTRMAWAGCSVARIRAEIARCEVRCANCHRRVTVARRREPPRTDGAS